MPARDADCAGPGPADPAQMTGCAGPGRRGRRVFGVTRGSGPDHAGNAHRLVRPDPAAGSSGGYRSPDSAAQANGGPTNETNQRAVPHGFERFLSAFNQGFDLRSIGG